jgi:hypothetical protein
MFPAANVIAIKPAVNGLFATAQKLRELVPVVIRKLRFGLQDHLPGNGTFAVRGVQTLDSGHRTVFERENVRDIDNHKTTRLYLPLQVFGTATVDLVGF